MLVWIICSVRRLSAHLKGIGVRTPSMPKSRSNWIVCRETPLVTETCIHEASSRLLVVSFAHGSQTDVLFSLSHNIEVIFLLHVITLETSMVIIISLLVFAFAS